MSSLPATMKAVVVRTPGDASSLEVTTNHPTPTLLPGQVLVKNEFAGVNFIDTYHRSGLYPRSLPFALGVDGGGVVVAVTPEVDDNIKVGVRVAYNKVETYCEYTAVPADKLVPIPDDMDTEVAVACMVQGLTAHYLVTSAHANLITKGEWCLIYSVGSGTCQWAAQMARARGYKVIGTCSKGKADSALKCCDELIVLQEAEGASYADYNSVDIVARVLEITGNKGVKCVIDGVGKSTVDISLNCLATRGIFISFGNASGPVPAFPLLKLSPKSAFVTRPKAADYTATREELMERAEEVFQLVKDGTIKISIDKVFDLEDVVNGHVYLESGKSRGKLLFRV